MNLVDERDLDVVVDALLRRAWITEPDRLPVVVTPNVDIVVQLETLAPGAIHRQFADGWCVLPDGQPLVFLGRACRVSLRSRLAGSSLVELLLPRLSEQAAGMLLFAPNGRVAAMLSNRHPGADVVVPPVIRPGDLESVRSTVRDALCKIDHRSIEYVIIGISFPASSALIDELMRTWPTQPSPVYMGVGGSFEMYLGLKRRAPQWMQDIGFEWLFRFSQEPRRLYRRYLFRDPRFVMTAYRALREVRARTEPAGEGER